jgi:predicted permease
VNATVLVAIAALLVPTVLLFALVPAIRLSRVHLGTVLAHAGRQRASSLSRRTSQALIAAEVALAVVLVAGAGLMIRSFARLVDVDLGFNPRQLLTMDVLPLDASPEAQQAYYDALLRRVRTLSGIESAGIVDNFSLQGVTRFSSVRAGSESIGTTTFRATPGYLETIGAALVAGRLPADAESAAGAAVAVVNESAARAIAPDGTAIGREIIPAGSDARPLTVVGVFRDIRHNGPLASRDTASQVFYPLELTKYDSTTAMTVVMRVSDNATDLPNRLRQAAQSIGPRVLVQDIRAGETLFGAAVITPRRRLVLLGLLGSLGLVLALVGVFGMTAYAVARRTAEIGVRMAFGARPGQVVAAMARDSAVPVVIGAIAGVGGALLATRVIESFLFETSARDPLTLAAVAVTLATTGCLAALVPAFRAARVDPALSLRA